MQKILVIQQKMIGDVLTSSILLEALKNEFPEAQLHYLINSHTQPVIINNPFVDKLILFTPEMEKNGDELKRLRADLKSEGYTQVIDVYSKIGSARLAKATGAKEIIGYRKWYTRWAYSHTLKRRKQSYTTAGLAIENRLLLLEKIFNTTFEPISPKIYLTEEEKDLGLKMLHSHGIDSTKKLYQISVLGSGSTKTYPLDYMAQLLDYVVSTSEAQLIFNYIPSQREEVDTLYNLCSEETQRHIFLDCYGSSLREFLAITSHCDALIGNEGGAINMAKALDIPTFAIFCPWIKKEAWSMFEDNIKHVSVHLYDYLDYLPEFSEKKRSKKSGNKNYNLFTPELIIPKLHLFINKSQLETSDIKLSATVITYNEEDNIARCIESLLPVSDDIVIVDSHSTDQTETICSQYPVRFIKNDFEGHIQQKNLALSLAKYDNVVSLDADEALSKELQSSILRLKRDFKKDGYYIQRYNNYCGQWINYSDWNPDRKLRVFDKTKARWDGINPHDQIHMNPKSDIGVLKGDIFHWVHSTHEEHRKKIHKFSSIAAGEYFKLGRTSNWLDITIKPVWIFIRSYILRLGFLDGHNGLILCKFSAQTTYLKYSKLRQLIKEQKESNS